MRLIGFGRLALTAMLVALSPARDACAGLLFNFTPAQGMSQQAIDGFNAAGALWASRIADNVAVNISIGFSPLGSGILGQASSPQSVYSYASVRSALSGHSTSNDDATAVANLQPGSGVAMLINGTANNPNGSGSATPYLDNDGNTNNTSVRLTNANAKALGLLGASAPTLDATIAFSSSFSFDFDPSNGIDSGSYDFVGIAAHEIGHALGFTSGVDTLDLNSPPNGGPFNDSQFSFVTTLDLFRYSTLSTTQGAIDWTVDTRQKYFSIDGGASALGGATFSTGLSADGRQASHWKDSLGIGIMDPTAGLGERLTISSNDLRAFDVIGYTLVSPPSGAAPTNGVPEPATYLVALVGLGLPLAFRRIRG